MGNYILTSSKSSQGSNFNCYFLPKAVLHLKMFRTTLPTASGKNKYAFRFEHNIIQTTDPKNRFYLQYHPNTMTDDSVKVDFTPEGFLHRVETITEDKTGAIIDKLAELGKSVAQVISGIPDFVDRSVEERLVYEVTFDPFIVTELEAVNQELVSFKSPDFPDFFPSIEVRLFDEQESAPSAGKAVNSTDFGNGIFCRPLASAEITFKAGKGAERHYVTIPHPYKIHLVEIVRPRWIKYTFSMEFEKGFPKSISINRPSQMLAALNIPVRLLQSIFSIPAKLIPVNINLDNTKQQAAAPVQQIQQQIDNQKQMLDLQQQIANMKPENGGGEGSRSLGERGGNNSGLNPNRKYLTE